LKGYEILLIIALLFLGFLIKSLYERQKEKKQMLYRLREGYGGLPENDYSAERYESIGFYHTNYKKDTPVIDDITWNDLDMDTVFMVLNNTCTGVGEEHLYAMLRTPCFESDTLKERNRIAEYFDAHEDERLKVQSKLLTLGKHKKIGIYEYIHALRKLEKHNILPNIVMCGAIISAFIGLLINLSVFLMAVFVVMAVNMMMYFHYMSKIRSYFQVISYMVRLIDCAKEVSELNIPGIQSYSENIKKNLKPLLKIRKSAWLFASGNNAGNDIFDFVLDYVKMIFHIDIINFGRVVRLLNREWESFDCIMADISMIDCAIAIGSFRNYVGTYSIPKLSKNYEKRIKVVDVYHPLIENPVYNSLDETKSVLLTGSNASGKSTFLKTIAINAILSQTIYTSLSKEYQANYFRIYSSMALSDNIMGNESYYIVEIKSLKRILDEVDGSFPVLCFIDEVLRGTNTIERIAASSQILDYFGKRNVLCFAATHDIELTSMLKGVYANYHFQEEVKNNDILFDYKLYKGRATSRNAIKLLGIIGFGKDIIDKANLTGARFEKDGIWTL